MLEVQRRQLYKLAEELAEVQKEVQKCLRFGLDIVGPNMLTTNRENLISEILDLKFALKNAGLDFSPDLTQLKERTDKYNKFEKWYEKNIMGKS